MQDLKVINDNRDVTATVVTINVSLMRLSLSSGDQLSHTAAFPDNRADTSFILSVLHTYMYMEEE